MQTRKKVPVRDAAREHANPRSTRQQKKVHEHVHVAEKQVTELITSSARKPRLVHLSTGLLSKKSRDVEVVKDLNATYILAADEPQDLCLAYGTVGRDSVEQKGCAKTTHCVLETLFSPSYHISKDVSGGVHGRVDFIEYFRSEDQIDCLDQGSTDPQSNAVNCLVTLETSNSLGRKALKNSGTNMKTEHLPTWHSDVKLDVQNGYRPRALADECAAISSTAAEEEVGGNSSSSDTTSIYLAAQNSKLECVDEPSQDSVTTEVYVEADDEEMDDFDPYLFIKNLPDLSLLVPSFRPMLLPKQTRSCPPTTLVLDLDETLVHSTLEHCDDADFTFPVHFNLQEHTVYVRCRPYLRNFMERVASLFEIIVFTASQSIYAEQLLNVLDPKRRIFRHRVYRESCVFVDGNYLKDLTILGRDLARVAIIDNSPQAFGFQIDNGIPIESWFDDRSDDALPSLLPFLESLVGVEDVRPRIVKKFNLREKVAAAVDPSLNMNKRDPFDREL